MATQLPQSEIDALKDRLPAWTLEDGREAIRRRIVFADFAEALAAMVRIGVEADKADHHPEWSNVYDKLDIRLTTHDAGGLSQRDVDLAGKIDAMFPA